MQTSKWIQYANPQKLNPFVISFNPRKHLNAIVFYRNVDLTDDNRGQAYIITHL